MGRTGLGIQAVLVAVMLGLTAAQNSSAQSAPNVPPGVQDVIKLVKAGLGEDVVLSHIRNTGAFYNLSADQIIYLHDQGVTQNEIKALMGTAATAPTPAPTAPAPAPVVPSATPPVAPAPQYAPTPGAPPASPAPVIEQAQPTLTLSSFQAQLAPYGTWINIPAYGLCWRPSVASDPYWRPYGDQGHWVYTADGWYWQSDYPWGDIAFHYGRWFRDSLGWVWVPGYDWAPAWVCWRQADAYCGWAPLPPAAVYRVGVGLTFGGHVAVDLDFGLGADAFVFVPYDHFWDHNFHAYILPYDRVRVVFGHSVVMNGYRVEHGRFIVEGIGHERMAVLTHRDIRIEEVGRHGDPHGHGYSDHRAYNDDRRDHHDH